ncbi:MAG: hypothetical protein JWM28_4423, partial [Chitinophagaceae bacterium]|nr:hypothetical protein [Chitinophagaceae bacterium]
LLAIILLISCKETYDPPVVKTNLNLLVVDGFLNNSSDTTLIRLSHTRKLADGTANSAESISQITLEDATGATLYHFQEMGDGQYIVPGINLDVNKKFKLRIKTADGKQYASDEIEVKQTPLIDSVSWQMQNNGVRIFVSTHDPQNNTKYYRWDYTDTWEYHSNYFSSYKFENHAVLPRQNDELVFQCWKTNHSTDLLLGSSAKLSQDIINLSPIRFIAANSIEISVKYSILVKQYAITKDGYEYLQNLKKISEQLGSIFDAQPSQLTGNIHSLNDPAETVLGFVTASTLNEKRIFIDHEEVKPWNYQVLCDERRIVPLDSLEDFFGDGQLIPISEAHDMRGLLIGYYGGTRGCVDCTTRGGSNKKPDFWP